MIKVIKRSRAKLLSQTISPAGRTTPKKGRATAAKGQKLVKNPAVSARVRPARKKTTINKHKAIMKASKSSLGFTPEVREFHTALVQRVNEWADNMSSADRHRDLVFTAGMSKNLSADDVRHEIIKETSLGKILTKNIYAATHRTALGLVLDNLVKVEVKG